MDATNENTTRRPCPVCESVRRAIVAVQLAFDAETDVDEEKHLDRAARYLDLAHMIAHFTNHGAVDAKNLEMVH